jgi:flagellar hook-associated protein 1 FlgK
MTNSIYGIALSGLNAARAGLTTTSHNIANANTVGYSRQQVIQAARPSQGGDIGYIGQGVDIASVQRVYSDFLNTQLQQATSDSSFYEAKAQQIAQVDSTVADDSSGIATALGDFFSAAQKLSSTPSDLPARQNYLSASSTLAARFNSFNSVLEGLRSSTNMRVKDTVAQLNEMSTQIASLNEKIVAVSAQTFNGGPPNDLMDQRDKLISQISEQVQVTKVNMDDGSVNLFLGNGQPLVVSNHATTISTEIDPNDSQNLLVGIHQTVNGVDRLITFDGNSLGKGALAGYLSFRDTELAQYQNQVGLMAARLGQTVNSIQTAGADLNGNAGNDLFTFGSGTFLNGISRVAPNLNNSTSNPTNVTITNVDLSKISGVDYEINIISGVPNYREAGSGAAFTPATYVSSGNYYDIQDSTGASLVSFQLDNASPTDGDSFTLMPVREAALNMGVGLTKPAEIAAASSSSFSVGDNTSILAVTALQTSRTLFQENGSAGVSISDAFNQLVSNVGNKTRELESASESRKAILDQAAETRDALSGVNMDEEAATLLKYQQAYQASGRVISLAKEMFEQILQIF